MKVDTVLAAGLDGAAAAARAAEAAGYQALWCPETSHDPFLPLVLAAEHTGHLQLGTAVAVAFARNPLTLATLGHDLQAFSRGRLLLGLGSQVKAHVTRRFSMPWSHPAPRMRELISAMRAVWDCWDHGAPLDFRGDFYTHTLMTPFFDPGPSPYGPPRVFLAAVGEGMTVVAGTVADGLVVHPFTTERYLREVTLPALERGLAASGRTRADVEVCVSPLVAAGDDEGELAANATAVRHQIAFYGSTPAYRGVLELHGWGQLHAELRALARQGRWAEMGSLVDDEVLDAFAVVGETDALARLLRRRFADVAERLTLFLPGVPAGPAAAIAEELAGR